MLKSMLEFNPYFRISARTCLEDSMFNDIRKESLEVGAPFKINLKCDKLNSYDYDNNVDNQYKTI